MEVLAFEDLNGNPEWWQCRNAKGKEGKGGGPSWLNLDTHCAEHWFACVLWNAFLSGFVAANFLQKLDEGESMKGTAVVEEDEEELPTEEEEDRGEAASDVLGYAVLGFDYEADSDFEVAVSQSG